MIRRNRFNRRLSLRIDAIQRQIIDASCWPPSIRKTCVLARLRFQMAQLEAKL